MPNCQSCDGDIPKGSRFCNHCGKKQPDGPKRRRAKSANGQGSVIKLGGRRSKPWAAYTPAKYENTKLVKPRRMIGTFATEGEARNAILSLPEVASTDLYNYTVEQVYEVWKAEHFQTIGPKGQEGYENSWVNLSTPVKYKDPQTGENKESYPLHNKKARELMKLDFQQIINALAAAGKSLSKCQKVRQLMSQLCKWCLDHELLTRNLAENLRLPKPPDKEKRIFTDDEIDLIEQFLDSPNKSRRRIAQITMILCYTGFRVSALYQMRIKDIHIDEQTGEKKVSYMIGGVKTDEGKHRLVPINKRILPIVRELAGGKASDDLLIVGLDGKPMQERTARWGFTEMVKEIGAGDATLHSCRHTYATKHARAETRPEILSKLMGHTDYDITKIYTHSTILDLVAADEKVK